MGAWGDPSRLYTRARRARIMLDEARERLAELIRAEPGEIVFTSGGTESCNLALLGAARAARGRPRRVVVSAIEHHAVLEAAARLRAEGFELVKVPVDGRGIVDLEAFEEALAPGAAVASVMHANHEVGSLQPVRECARLARERKVLFHTDACQTVGHLPLDVEELGVDLLSGSSHKAYGPPGAGFLYVRRGTRLSPLIVGDDRERGRRAGFENLPSILGMVAAVEARREEMQAEAARLAALRGLLREELLRRVAGVRIHGDPDTTLPHMISFTVEEVEGEALVHLLDARGVSVHSGSSCTSARLEPSHVLEAMGLPAEGAVRVSMGRWTQQEDVLRLLEVLPEVVERLRALAHLPPEGLADAVAGLKHEMREARGAT